MSVLPIKTLLEAGAHFGHETKRWNPKMSPFIYAKRNGIHIIDLQKTSALAETAYERIKDTVKKGDSILFVGTKKQAKDSIEEFALKCHTPYVNNRWLGGTLTNFDTIRHSINKLKELEELEKNNFTGITKKEISRKRRVLDRLEKHFSGIKHMDKLPGMLFVVDTVYEVNAILEARKMNIPIVAIADTNSDPDCIDFPIPGNDDAIRAVSIFCDMVCRAIVDAQNEMGITPQKVQSAIVNEPPVKKAETSDAETSDIDSEPDKDLSSDIGQDQ